MTRTRIATLGTAAVALALALAGCSEAGQSGSASGDGEDAGIGGTITVLTNRTDLVDTLFADYKSQFEQKYPGTDVEFESITDYEGEVTTRMNTDQYGDVLIIPTTIKVSDYANYFEPLGTADELSASYNYLSGYVHDGQVYAIPDNAGVNGVLYNKKVWQTAGITELPRTPDEFVNDLKQIKAKTDAIPYYTNYAAGWPLSQWEGLRGAISGSAEAANHLTEIDAPWAPGEEHYVLDSMLYDLVADGLVEQDPTTTDWELSKQMMADGEIATMVLGSWSIVQVASVADDAQDIAYMPFPNEVDGKFYVPIAADGPQAVNVHSTNKATARAWIDFMAGESGYAQSQDLIPTQVGADFPDSLKSLQSDNVEFLQLNPAPAGMEGLLDSIDNGAEIGLWDPTYRQNIVDTARGQVKGDKQSIFDDLDSRWAAARAKVQG